MYCSGLDLLKIILLFSKSSTWGILVRTFFGGGAGCLKQIQETDEHNGSLHQLKHGSFLVHGYTQDLP